MRITLSPVREPLVGSASSGQPAASASTRAGGPASSPATTTVRRSALTGSGEASGRAPGVIHGPPCGAPSSALPQPSPASGTSGSSNWRLRCTGPGRAPRRPVATAALRAASERQPTTCRRSASPEPACGAGTSAESRTALPKMPAWSVVWFAFVPRSRAGRSAVSRISGTPACDASSTAGCRFATAVPLVVTTATGRRLVRARPTARKPADRSSMRVCSRTRSRAA